MSLESAIERLAAATENNAAVREIIRQRDEAQKALKGMTDSRDMYRRFYEDEQTRAWKLERKARALRGAITRIKRRGMDLEKIA